MKCRVPDIWDTIKELKTKGTLNKTWQIQWITLYHKSENKNIVHPKICQDDKDVLQKWYTLCLDHQKKKTCLSVLLNSWLTTNHNCTIHFLTFKQFWTFSIYMPQNVFVLWKNSEMTFRWMTWEAHQSTFNAMSPYQNGWHFSDGTFKTIFLKEKFCVLIKNFTEVCSCGTHWHYVNIGSDNGLAIRSGDNA